MSGIIHSIIKVAIIVVSVLGIIAQVQAEPLRVGFFGNPPHVVSDHQDGAKGPAVEYFRLIAKKMGITDVVFKELPMARLLSYLEKGKSDAAMILAKAPGRAAMFAYPKEPYFSIRSAIVVDRSNPLGEIKSLDDLLPLRIAVYAKAYLSPIMCDKRLKITPLYEADVNDVAYGLLLRKRIDAFYSPDFYSLRFTLKKGGYESKLKILQLPEPWTSIFMPFSRQSAEKYLEKYEVALDQVRKVRSYEKILEKFMGGINKNMKLKD